MSNSANKTDDVRETARRLLESVKGIERARVEVDARGQITQVELLPKGIDDRQAMRNAQSALMAVLGQNIDINAIAITSAIVNVPQATAPLPANVVEMKPQVREAARAAFDTLRAAQSSFHGFQFDGAELVKISGTQYVVVAVKRDASRYCGAAPVTESVSEASARALMNAVGVAAMGATQMDINGHNGDYDVVVNS